jgi:superfamily I DNA and/or RNA helicase
MLDTQYRMHPDISLFSNVAFYDGQLRDGVNAAELAAPRTSYLPTDSQGQTKHLGFIDHGFPETPRSKSLANEGDADIVCDIVADLLACNPVRFEMCERVTISATDI